VPTLSLVALALGAAVYSQTSSARTEVETCQRRGIIGAIDWMNHTMEVFDDASRSKLAHLAESMLERKAQARDELQERVPKLLECLPAAPRDSTAALAHEEYLASKPMYRCMQALPEVKELFRNDTFREEVEPTLLRYVSYEAGAHIVGTAMSRKLTVVERLLWDKSLALVTHFLDIVASADAELLSAMTTLDELVLGLSAVGFALDLTHTGLRARWRFARVATRLVANVLFKGALVANTLAISLANVIDFVGREMRLVHICTFEHIALALRVSITAVLVARALILLLR
jgi:hypothetical protein